VLEDRAAGAEVLVCGEFKLLLVLGSAAKAIPAIAMITAEVPVNASEDQIKAAQQQLKTAGLYNGSVDGKMGAETKEALQQFQKQHGLQATGALDQQTLAALQSNTGRAGSTAAPTGQPSTAGAYNNNSSNPHR
jgi:peptidoglycan hydrolase-like protein with peptidoglycan-binding domain